MPRKQGHNKKKVNKSGLGRSLKNKYGGKPEIENRAQGRTKSKEGFVPEPFKKAPEKENAAAKLRSVTEMTNLEEFMETVIARKKLDEEQKSGDVNRLVITDSSESMASREHRARAEMAALELFEYENLPIPRKPKWDETTTAEQLKHAEELAFIDWRRRLAATAKASNLEMTPFEKNLSVWKQLWIVVERAHLLVLIVDARNPLAFISRDLFRFVEEVDEKKKCLLMMNKADYLSARQRAEWRRYFESRSVSVLYFSALREEMRMDLVTKSHRDRLTAQRRAEVTENVDGGDPDEMVSVEGMMSIFEAFRRSMAVEQLEVGLVGYPNVGKSSVINVLMAAKRVSTGSTPGKTKHFQTLQLSPSVTLCDCPGLVFPTLCSSKADLVLNGCVSVDSLTDFISPSRLMLHRVTAEQINRVYKLRLPTTGKRARMLTVFDVLDSYCHQKKMYNKSKVCNRSEAARVLLKDYVRGKTVFVHCPPSIDRKQRAAFYGRSEHEKDGVNGDGDRGRSAGDGVEAVDNVLDEEKLMGSEAVNVNVDLNVDRGVIGDDGDMDGGDVEDDEFLDLWKHPLDGYVHELAPTKRKRNELLQRRIERRQQKHNRALRRNADNFVNGSNAVVIDKIPRRRLINRPI